MGEGRVLRGQNNPVITRLIARRLGLIVPQARKPEPDLTTNLHIKDVLDEREGRFQHPDLPGRLYDSVALHASLDLINCAEQKFYNTYDEGLFTENTNMMADLLLADPLFRVATLRWDVRYQLKFALERLDIELHIRRVGNRMPDESTAKVRGLAKIDIDEANEIIRKYFDLEFRISGPLIEAGLHFIDMCSDPSNAFYFLLENMDAIRWVAHKSKDCSLSEALSKYKQASSILEHPWLSEFAAARIKDGTFDERYEIARQQEIIERRASDLESTMVPDEARKEAIEEANEAAAVYDDYNDSSSDDHSLRLSTISRGASIHPFRAALEVVLEERENRKVNAALYQLEGPLEDPRLETFLVGQPPIVCHVARSINHYVLEKTPFKDVPDVFKAAVAQNRVRHSYDRIVQTARTITSSLPRLPTYRHPEEDLSTDEYDTELEALDFKKVGYLADHFGDRTPSIAMLRNALVFLGIRQGDMEVDHTYSIIAGSCESDGSIASLGDENPDFRFFVDKSTGTLTLLNGFQIPEIAYLDGMQVLDPEEEAKKLVFPLPNLIISSELESMLNARYPKSNPDGSTNYRNQLVRKVARTLLAYYYTNSEEANVREFMREKFETYHRGEMNFDVPSVYQEPYERLREGLSFEKLLKDSEGMVAERDFGHVQSQTLRPRTATLDELMLIANAMGLESLVHEAESIGPLATNAVESSGELSQDNQRLVESFKRKAAEAIDQFSSMHPGIRELKVRNHIAEADPEEEARRANIRDSLYQKLDISIPTPEQALEAAYDPANLSPIQRECVAMLYGIREGEVDKTHVYGMRLRLSAPMENVLSHWNKLNPEYDALVALEGALRSGLPLKGTQKRLFKRLLGKGNMSRISKTDRERVDLVTAQIRPYEENRRLWLSDTSVFWKDNSLYAVGELAYRVRMNSMEESDAMMLEKIGCNAEAAKNVFTKKSYYEDDERQYYPEILELVKEFDLSYSSYRESARRFREFSVLSEFLTGTPVRSTPKLTIEKGMTRKKDGKDKVNEDSYTSIVLADQTRLNAIFDGMGGHGNGDLASQLAKRMFEVAAFAGWIKNPDDVVRTLITIDLALVHEQISMKKRRGGVVESSMGTTVAVTLCRGNEFFGVHVGDSPYKIIRDRKVIMEATPHNIAYEAKRRGQTIDFDISSMSHFISSALGAESNYIDVNNGTLGPVLLSEGDIVMLSSDGVTDVVPDSEMLEVLRMTNNDLKQTASKLINLAVPRTDPGQEYSTMSGESVRGKGSDDKTLIFDKVEGVDE